MLESTEHGPDAHSYLGLIGGRIVRDGHKLLGVHTLWEGLFTGFHRFFSPLRKAKERTRELWASLSFFWSLFFFFWLWVIRTVLLPYKQLGHPH